MEYAVIVRGLSKRFYRHHGNRPWTLHEALVNGLSRIQRAECFWALRDVSFSVAPGNTLGIVGPNGSGKSTLLRLIGGIGRPDEGNFEVRKRVSALLDLGAGFHPDLTGRENVFISGVISGLTRREVKQKFDSIVAFAELEAFIDNPIRTYSTGMQMRLGFSIAVHSEPEILLIDEILSVGDHSFQRKCFERIAEFKSDGCTIILVSHDTHLVRESCDEAIWLSSGRLVLHGRPDVVVNQYIDEADAVMDRCASIDLETRRRTPKTGPKIITAQGVELQLHKNRFGSLELELIEVSLTDRNGRAAVRIDSGDLLRIEISYCTKRMVAGPIFHVVICREDGLVCYELDTETDRVSLGIVEDRGRIALQIDRVDLPSGSYYVDIGAYVSGWSYALDYHYKAYPLVLQGLITKREDTSPYHWEVNGEKPTLVSPAN
jgi:lipopolysaccharide transport system ATP-binding protein